MTWIYLIGAGILEVVWAYAMKLSFGFTKLWPSVITIAAMLISFWLLGIAMRTIDLGTAYIIWTGIGAVGAFILGIVLLGEAASAGRIIAALFIVTGLVMMQFFSA